MDWCGTYHCDQEPKAHSKSRQYKEALDALVNSSAKGAGKSGAGKSGAKRRPPVPSRPLLDIFKKHCLDMGVTFEPDKTMDIITLLASVKARADST